MDKLERLQTTIPDPTRSALASAVDGGRKVYMNMAKKLVLAAGLTLLGGTAAFGENARGYFNNWADDRLLTGTTVQYKVFGTMEPDDIDYMAGNAWHYPANTEPYASETMRTPLEVALGDHPYVRLGVNPTTGDDAHTKVQLKYKVGNKAWATLTMEPEPRGDGWQPKYDGNGYYAGSIPTDKFTVGMTVQYYFYLEYANSSSFTTTSVGTPDLMGSIAYLGGTRRGAIRSSSRSGNRWGQAPRNAKGIMGK